MYFVYRPVFDDRKTCWHGSGIYEDCNNMSWERNMKLRYKGGNCKWWHFYAHERYPEVDAKFKEILSSQPKNLVNDMMQAARKFQLNVFGKDFL